MYDTKLDLWSCPSSGPWEVWSTPSLPLFPDSLSPVGRIDLFKNLFVFDKIVFRKKKKNS